MVCYLLPVVPLHQGAKRALDLLKGWGDPGVNRFFLAEKIYFFLFFVLFPKESLQETRVWGIFHVQSNTHVQVHLSILRWILFHAEGALLHFATNWAPCHPSSPLAL